MVAAIAKSVVAIGIIMIMILAGRVEGAPLRH